MSLIRLRRSLPALSGCSWRTPSASASGCPWCRSLSLIGRESAKLFSGVRSSCTCSPGIRTCRREGELGGLFFELTAGLLDFVVLPFDFRVALGQLLGLALELFVGLRQLFLLRLQLCRELLRLLHTFKVTHLAFLEQLTQSIGVVLNTIEATMRTENLLQQSQQLTTELQSQQKELTADQRRARAQGQAAGRAQHGSRTEEQGSRAGPPRARGKGGRACPDVEVQVGVPGEHVARAAHAIEQHFDSRPAARRQHDRQSVAEAGGVRQEHPQRRL